MKLLRTDNNLNKRYTIGVINRLQATEVTRVSATEEYKTLANAHTEATDRNRNLEGCASYAIKEERKEETRSMLLMGFIRKTQLKTTESHINQQRRTLQMHTTKYIMAILTTSLGN